MSRNVERRKYKRLAAKYSITCRKIGSATEKPYTGHTINVSTGGLVFESSYEFKPGNLLKVELSIPPNSGQREFGGRISTFAKVLRASEKAEPDGDSNSSGERSGVALEFCDSPKLCT